MASSTTFQSSVMGRCRSEVEEVMRQVDALISSKKSTWEAQLENVQTKYADAQRRLQMAMQESQAKAYENSELSRRLNLEALAVQQLTQRYETKIEKQAVEIQRLKMICADQHGNYGNTHQSRFATSGNGGIGSFSGPHRETQGAGGTFHSRVTDPSIHEELKKAHAVIEEQKESISYFKKAAKSALEVNEKAFSESQSLMEWLSNSDRTAVKDGCRGQIQEIKGSLDAFRTTSSEQMDALKLRISELHAVIEKQVSDRQNIETMYYEEKRRLQDVHKQTCERYEQETMSLRSEKQALNQQLLKYSTQETLIAECSRELDVRDQEVAALQISLRELEEGKVAMREELREAHDRLQTVEHARHSLQMQYDREISAIKTSQEDSKLDDIGSNKKSEIILNEHRAELDKRDENIQGLRKTVQEFKKNAQSSTADLQKMNEMIETLHQERKTMSQQHLTEQLKYEDRIVTLQTNLDNVLNMVDSFEEQKAEYDALNEANELKIEQLKAAISGYKRDIVSFQDSQQSLQIDLEDREKAIVTYLSERRSLLDTVESLKTKLHTAESDRTLLLEQVEELSAKMYEQAVTENGPAIARAIKLSMSKPIETSIQPEEKSSDPVNEKGESMTRAIKLSMSKPIETSIQPEKKFSSSLIPITNTEESDVESKDDLQTAIWEREQFRNLAQLEAKRLQQLKDECRNWLAEVSQMQIAFEKAWAQLSEMRKEHAQVVDERNGLLQKLQRHEQLHYSNLQSSTAMHDFAPEIVNDSSKTEELSVGLDAPTETNDTQSTSLESTPHSGISANIDADTGVDVREQHPRKASGDVSLHETSIEFVPFDSPMHREDIRTIGPVSGDKNKYSERSAGGSNSPTDPCVDSVVEDCRILQKGQSPNNPRESATPTIKVDTFSPPPSNSPNLHPGQELTTASVMGNSRREPSLMQSRARVANALDSYVSDAVIPPPLPMQLFDSITKFLEEEEQRDSILLSTMESISLDAQASEEPHGETADEP